MRIDVGDADAPLRTAILFAVLAGALAVPALIVLVEVTARAIVVSAAPVARGLTDWAERALQPLRRARIAGALPTDSERMRLQAASALVGLALGGGFAGLKGGIALAAASSWFASRLLVWHRGRYRRRLDEGASAAAHALADAVAAGHSVRGALTLCGNGLAGPIGAELRTVGNELELGGETEDALDRLRLAAQSRRVDLIVAAVRVQRRSGGSLAALLRGIAATLEDHDRLDGEARAATAQARFTSVVVLLLPVGGLLLAELVTPGIVGRMTGSAAGGWLLGAAAVLQLLGVLVIRRLSRLG